MALDLKQSLKLGQQLLMTPQLQQAIKMLQLSRIELEQFVNAQLAENPVLEEGVVESAEEITQVEREKERTEKDALAENMGAATEIVDKVKEEKPSDVDWESYTSRMQDNQLPASKVRKDDDFPSHENFSKEGSLQDYLRSQVGEIDLDDNEIVIAREIVGNINERGYLEISVADISSKLGVNEDLVEDILDVVQRLDPVSVGSRDLKECLLIQLRSRRLKNGIVERIVSDHLEDLQTRNFSVIAKALNISVDNVIENVQIISELEPVPGRQFGASSTHYIVPDVYVFKVGDEWVVSLNEEGLPHLRISKMYEEMAQKSGLGEKEKEYIDEKLKSASWLIKSIQQRQRTIFRVTEKLVERQKEFFEEGISKLKPMILKNIAEDIGMHESTISRVTNSKYVHTPQGIFELKFFFNSSVNKTGGEVVASAAVKQMISDLIKKENPKKPLSDQKIVDFLDEKGIELARRTVAKYREQLGILPSSKRKKLF